MTIHLYIAPSPDSPADPERDVQELFVVDECDQPRCQLVDSSGSGVLTPVILMILKLGGFLVLDTADGKWPLVRYLGLPACHALADRVITIEEGINNE